MKFMNNTLQSLQKRWHSIEPVDFKGIRESILEGI